MTGTEREAPRGAPGTPLATGGSVAVEDKDLTIGSFEWKERPKGAVLVYQLGRWYRSGNGVEFTLAEVPQMVAGKPGYWVGSVLLRDGRVAALSWGPKTRPLSWWERLSYELGIRKEKTTP